MINGQKPWTSLVGDADYCWPAVRTDPEAPKHAGISIFIVDMKKPGIRTDELNLLSMHDIHAVFLDDVRVTICSLGVLDRAFFETRRWAQQTKLPDGRRVIDQESQALHRPPGGEHRKSGTVLGFPL